MTTADRYAALADQAARWCDLCGLPADTRLTWLVSDPLGATAAGEAVTVGTKSRYTHAFAATVDKLAAAARDKCHQADFPNLYLTSGLHDPPNQRRQDTCTRVLTLTLDADACDWLSATSPAEYADAAAAKAALHELEQKDLAALLRDHKAALLAALLPLGLEPTALVESGYGHYALLVLADDDGARDVALCREVNADLVAALNAAAGYDLVDTVAKDCGTRVLRLPGSFNVKNSARPRRCHFLATDGPVYPIAALRSLVPRPERPAPSPARSAAPREAAGDGRLSDMEVARRAIELIPADHYQVWIGVGKALHAVGLDLTEWEAWSATSAKHQAGECERRWRTFDGADKPDVAVGYLVNRARERDPDFLAAGYRRGRDQGCPVARQKAPGGPAMHEPDLETKPDQPAPLRDVDADDQHADIDAARAVVAELVDRVTAAAEAERTELLSTARGEAAVIEALNALRDYDRPVYEATRERLRGLFPRHERGRVKTLFDIAEEQRQARRRAEREQRRQAAALASEERRHQDLALAEAFAEQHRGEWLPAEGRQWYRYVGGVWQQRAADEVRGLLWQFVDELTADGANKRLVDSVFDAAATLTGWRAADRDLNRNPMLVNVRNGVYDLEAGELRPHDPALLQTVQRPFEYDAEATCPRWRQFLAETLVTAKGEPDPDLPELLQEWFGYCLVPTAKAQKAMIWTGEGSNGKGVATAILAALVGDANTVATDISKLDEDYKRADLRDKLLAVSSEVPTRALISDASFKAAVAGDLLPARLPHCPPFSFRPYARFLITCNKLPASHDQTFAFYRRLILVPWNACFEEGKGRNDELEDELVATELPGIFRWAVNGLARLVTNKWRFTSADAAEQALAAYRAEGNSVAVWANERTEVADPKEGAWTTTSAAYQDYAEFCRAGNLQPFGISQFPQKLKALFPTVESDRDGRVRKLLNLRLLEL